eukprot:CAMPEP_0174379968 /NCGR_PEP_ID=MMETSP0811_2-20130205/123056_1 /TAXON_ID=73025 ORGANISM="Eutreptiella gymnastica-like, Strain CCMP1594" /NCGR_SAMPLE_ID=MMETSP0811_2 /ASSEMBLY_ACC=CAM_ASM_000667 /LENGTH=65 /DNA_ID=CAMNT_0015532671 /DNA_START=1516 /DNA_END=1713 /DNA_ORIENTATION=-
MAYRTAKAQRSAPLPQNHWARCRPAPPRLRREGGGIPLAVAEGPPTCVGGLRRLTPNVVTTRKPG